MDGYMDHRRRSPSPRPRYSPRRRSPSPMRRRSRSRSPYRYRSRSRTPDRYRRRHHSRSPSPRHYHDRRRFSPHRRPNFNRRPKEIIRGSEEDRMKSCSIFVGNLPYSFEERDVVNLFERFGRIRQISVPIDRYTHRNRGFTFIEFENRAEAEEAFKKYDGFEIEGRKLRLDWDIGRNAKDTVRGVSPRRESRETRESPRGRSRSRSRSPMRASNSRSPSPRRD